MKLHNFISLNANTARMGISMRIKRAVRYAAAGMALGAGISMIPAAQAAETPQCELKRAVRFGGMNWESNLVLVEIERFIMEKGYGCKTDVLPTETLPALAALERGDLDINTEIWLNTIFGPWSKAEKTGKVKRIGDLYAGGEAWFIPRYTAEKLPALKKVSDLPKFKDAFKDPEEPNKGRFYGCPAGWGCEIVNANLHKALGLNSSFTLYSPGTGAAQKAALISAYKRKQDIVFYYWYPTSLVGSLDLVRLEFPPYNAADQACLTDAACKTPKATAYPDNPVFTAVNTRFAQEAPQLTSFLSRVNVPLPVMEKTLAYMEESGDDAAAVARWFLKNKPEIWTTWLSEDTALRIKTALR